MTDARSLDLSYGHLGEPVYDVATNRWEFPRQPLLSGQFKPVGQPVIALEPHSHSPHIRSQSAAERSQNVRRLAQQYPELATSAPLLPELAQISEIVNEVTSSHDPSISDLLAFGRATDARNPRLRTGGVPIAALAGATVGTIRLVVLTRESLGWERNKSGRLKTLTAAGGQQAAWSTDGGPVQQLCFAEGKGQPNTWLAVRCPRGISVLRPRLQAALVVPNSSHSDTVRSPQSLLDANPIKLLPIQKSRGVPFADVSFNPWNHKEIATVDQDGYWAVWNIGLSSKHNVPLKVNEASVAVNPRDEDEALSHDTMDGWGAILWAGDSDTLVIACRNMLTMVNIRDKSRRRRLLDHFQQKPGSWILDVKRCPSDPSLVFLVTSSTISCLRIGLLQQELNIERSEIAAPCLLSWQHFQSEEDISLHMHLLPTAESSDATTVLLYSRLKVMTIVYTFRYMHSSSGDLLSSSDPYLFPFASYAIENEQLKLSCETPLRISSLVLKPVKSEGLRGLVPSGPTSVCIQGDVEFYHLTVLFNNLTLSECLYAMAGDDLHPNVPGILSRFEFPRTPARVKESFIVPNGKIDDGEDFIQELSYSQGQKEAHKSAEYLPTITFGWLEAKILWALDIQSASKSIDQAIERIHASTKEKYTSMTIGIQTMIELGYIRSSINNIDEASKLLTQAIEFINGIPKESDHDDKTNTEDRPAISDLLPTAMRSTFGFSGELSLLGIYDSLVSACITPLSHRVRGRIRVTAEKVLRETAVQVFLACYGVRFHQVLHEEHVTDPGEDLTVDEFFTLPVRMKGSTSSLIKGKGRATERSSSPLVSSPNAEDGGFLSSSPSHALPTPDPTPSLRSRSSASSLTMSEDPAIRRLRALADVEPQPNLPPEMSRNRDDWQLGGDPEEYNWERAMQARLVDDDTEDESPAKKRRRYEKQRKRQRIFNVGSLSQPLPRIRFGDSQSQLTQETQNNSQLTDGMVTQSQTETGRNGGRLGKAFKKKVKKPSGFK